MQNHNVWFWDSISSNTVALLEVLWQDIEVAWPFNVLWILAPLNPLSQNTSIAKGTLDARDS